MYFIREYLVALMPLSTNGNIGGDPQYYLVLAQKILTAINTNGFNAYELRPEGQGISGVAALLFLIYDNIYSIVLVNALLHATSVAVIVLLLRMWFTLHTSIIASLPLAISPYMIVWFSQINKESFVITGGVLFVYGFVKLYESAKDDISGKSGLQSLVMAVSGLFLIFLMRPYVNQILLPIISIVFLIRSVYCASTGLKPWILIRFLSYASVLIVTCSALGTGAVSDSTLNGFDNYADASMQSHKSEKIYVQCLSFIDASVWHDAEFMPSIVNKKIKALMANRCLIFSTLEGQRNLATIYSFTDTNIFPKTTIEGLEYIPRGALIGVFSPWPDHWFYNFKNEISLFYTIVPFEALFFYMGMIALILWGGRKRDALIIIPVGLSVSMMAVYGVAVPYLGALYRYRYTWWMLILCFGFAALIDLYKSWHSHHAYQGK
ncbi:hypothetical protein B9Z35_09180 [Limnohabitans sp. Jir61]|nr:hypothetical protein B9Z35_09180 [Limnohabitans sp. Jir61]